MIDAIDARATRNDEEWLITITSDHGGTKDGHGPKTEENKKIAVLLHGDVLRSGKIVAECEGDIT